MSTSPPRAKRARRRSAQRVYVLTDQGRAELAQLRYVEVRAAAVQALFGRPCPSAAPAGLAA